jgi:hypothetical protein
MELNGSIQTILGPNENSHCPLINLGAIILLVEAQILWVDEFNERLTRPLQEAQEGACDPVSGC